MFEEIKSLRPHFHSLREIQNNVSLDIKVPLSWKYEDIVKPYRTVTLKVQDKNDKFNLVSFISQATQEGYDVVFACADEIFRYNNRTGGGIIMCHRNMINTWYTIYYNILHRFMKLDLFAGKEQSTINCICMIYPEIVELIQPINPPFDKWFYLLYYFSDSFRTD